MPKLDILSRDGDTDDSTEVMHQAGEEPAAVALGADDEAGGAKAQGGSEPTRAQRNQKRVNAKDPGSIPAGYDGGPFDLGKAEGKALLASLAAAIAIVMTMIAVG